MLEEIETRWRQALVAPYPGDRHIAEAAIRQTYRAADYQEPAQILWFDNPRDAAIANHLLHRPDDSLPAQPLNRRCTLSVREKIMSLTGLERWEAVRPWVGPRIEFTKKLMPWARGVWSSNPRILAPAVEAMKSRLYKIALDWIGLSQATISEAIRLDGGPPYGQLLGCIISLQGPAAITELAVFDYLAELGEIPENHTFRGIIDSAQQCFNWWAFRDAAIVCSRHIGAQRDAQGRFHSTTGPAILFPDGWGVFAFEGSVVEPHWITQPESLTVSEIQTHREKRQDVAVAPYGERRYEDDLRMLRECRNYDSPILREPLPSDPAHRLERLRSYSPALPFFQRYLRGEHQTVWRELQTLGLQVRQDPYAADALAVATETMARVRSNVQLLVSRLPALKYEFETDGALLDEREAKLASLAKEKEAESPAGILRQTALPEPVQKAMQQLKQLRAANAPKVAKMLRDIEMMPRDYTLRAVNDPPVGIHAKIAAVEAKSGPLPISLRAFYEVVGDISLRGNHRPLNGFAETTGDPLVVDPLELANQSGEEHLSICEDACFKGGFSGGAGYAVPAIA
jgi:hypothetical protein